MHLPRLHKLKLRPTLAAALLSIAGGRCAMAQSPLVIPVPSATALTIVAPEFPPDTSAGAAGARVDVEGAVLADGRFEFSAIRAEPGMERFAAAVQDVLKWWRFVPAIDGDACAPMTSHSRFAVWFEGSSAAPKVFVSLPKPAESVLRQTFVASFDAPSAKYPEKFFGVEGEVRVLRKVDPAGRVKAVAVRSSTPYGAFDGVVVAAAKRTRVTWNDPKPERDVCVEQVYRFCMQWKGDVRVGFNECNEAR